MIHLQSLEIFSKNSYNKEKLTILSQCLIQALIWFLGIIGLSNAESHINSFKEAKKDQSKPRQWRPSQKRARSGFSGPEIRGAPLQKECFQNLRLF